MRTAESRIQPMWPWWNGHGDPGRHGPRVFSAVGCGWRPGFPSIQDPSAQE